MAYTPFLFAPVLALLILAEWLGAPKISTEHAFSCLAAVMAIDCIEELWR